MFVELAIAGSFMLGRYVYHRWIEDKPTKKAPDREIQIPRVDTGAAVPMIYGRTRVRAPILVANARPASSLDYEMNMFYVLGIPFAGGRGTNMVHNMWAGDSKALWTPLGTPTGNGGPESGFFVLNGSFDGNLGQGFLEFLNGNPTQVLANQGETSANAFTWAGRHMLKPRGAPLGDPNAGGFGLTLDEIPGYRGYMSAFLYYNTIGRQWQFGGSATVPAYSFEVSSYHTNHPQLGLYSRIGPIESNPANAIFDLLTSPFKLGIPEQYIDMTSFKAAQYTLYTELHGYSRSVENAAEADEHIQEILRQIDGVLRHNPATDKIELKLIRNDYDPNTIPHITKDKGSKLQSFAMGGWSNLNNSVRLIYTNRGKDYQDDSVTAENQANALSIGGSLQNPLVLQYPGVCYETLAQLIANRELAARSRPIIKMRVLVDRSYLRVLQGDAVKVTWTNPDVSGLVFRVANVDHGTLEDGKIALDLIQDFNYVHRNRIPVPPVPTIPTPPIDVLGG